MAVKKLLIIEIEDGQINIDRKGLDINDTLGSIGALIYDVASHLEEVSTADVAFDAVNIANLYEEKKHKELSDV